MKKSVPLIYFNSRCEIKIVVADYQSDTFFLDVSPLWTLFHSGKENDPSKNTWSSARETAEKVGWKAD